MVLKALQLDPQLAEAHGALGFIKTWYDWDWNGAEREIRSAMKLNPGSDRHHLWYSHYLMLQGRYEEARIEIGHALELDPHSVVLHRELGLISYFAREYEQAVAILERTLERDPSIMYAHAHLGAAYLAESMYAEALDALEKEKELARESHTWADTLEGMTRLQMGQPGETKEVLTRLLERSERSYVSPFHLSCLYFELRNDEAGFQWLNTAYEGQDHWLCFLKAVPTYDRIRNDPRCVAVMERMNSG